MVKQLISMSAKFVRDVSGATAIEYGMIATGIAIVIIGAIVLLGDQLTTLFTAVATAFSG